MAKMRWERCKFHLNLSKKSKHDYQLRPIGGDCLEAVGVPDNGRALINCQIEPKVGDLVWCDNYMGTIHGYIKQVKSIDGDEMIVQTRYKDKSRDFEFYASTVHGVVEMVFDVMGDLRYKRPEVARKGETTYVKVGDTVYYCYDLFGEHLVQECTIEEMLQDRGGIKSLSVHSVDGKSGYVFCRESGPYTLDDVAFTKEKADKWLEAKG